MNMRTASRKAVVARRRYLMPFSNLDTAYKTGAAKDKNVAKRPKKGATEGILLSSGVSGWPRLLGFS